MSALPRPFATLAACALAVLGTILIEPSAAYAADRTPPTVPQALRVVTASTDTVALAWTASTDRSGRVTYRVLVDGVQVGTATQPSFTLTGLAPASTRSVAVRAEDRYGNLSAPSAVVAAVTAAGGATDAQRGAPTNLRVTASTYDSLSLAWDPAPGAVAYYQILRDGQWIDSAYGTAATVRSLSPGRRYTVEVRARTASGDQSAPAAITADTRADAGPPSTPQRLRVVTSVNGAPAGLAWDTSTDDRGVGIYWLFADGDAVFGGGPEVSFAALTDVLCTVVRGETYTFTVRAQDLTGSLSASGEAVTLTVP